MTDLHSPDEADDPRSVTAFLDFATRFAASSKSQILQDLWVIWELGLDSNRTFVDVGAADGVYLSNTYLLERLGWTGLLVEPNMNFHALLHSGRSSPVVQNCMWSESGRAMTLRSVDNFMELSRLDAVHTSDSLELAGRRNEYHEQNAVSITLEELLDTHSFPAVIDYLTIDIEGAEYEVFKVFNFNKYKFRCITVEHNKTPERDRIYELLTSHGYRRRWPEISEWDDWYVASDIRLNDASLPDLSKEAYRRLFVLQMKRGESLAAAKLALTIATRWSEDPELIASMASKLSSANQLTEARAVLTLGLEAQPRAGKLRFQRAVLLAKIKLFEESIEDFHLVADVDPVYATAQLHLSRALDALGRGPEALASAERAMSGRNDTVTQKHLQLMRSKWPKPPPAADA